MGSRRSKATSDHDSDPESRAAAGFELSAAKAHHLMLMTDLPRLSAIRALALLVAMSSGILQAEKPDSPKPAILHVKFTDAEGLPVRDLRVDELQVRIEGRDVPVDKLWGADQPFSVGMLIDVSPSIEKDIDTIRQDTSSFFHSLRENDPALIVTFDEEIYVDCDWTTDRKLVDEAIFELGLHKTGSVSIIFDALTIALEQRFNHLGPRRAMILFSDGVEIGGEVKREESLAVTQQSGTLVFALQYDSREHYRRLHGGAHYDPKVMRHPPGTTGRSVGGIFVGTNDPSERDWAEYKVQKTFERGSDYMREVAAAGRGPHHLMASATDLAAIYRRILEDLDNLSTVTFTPPRRSKADGLVGAVVTTSRPGVVVTSLTDGYWKSSAGPR